MLVAKPADATPYRAVNGRGEFYRSDQIEWVIIKPLLKDPAELVGALRQWFAERNLL